MADFLDWLDSFTGPDYIWYLKRLSGNDTLANGSHQAGPYIPREVLFRVLPSLNVPGTVNPDARFSLHLDSHSDVRTVRAIWYNNRLHGGTRNETRLTNFGGAASALLDPDNTGALTVFAFREPSEGAASECHVWVCRNHTEEELVEERVGPVEPGRWAVWSPVRTQLELGFTAATRASCSLEASDIPVSWLSNFPTGAEIIAKIVELRPDSALSPDRRLMRRRECEFEVFRSVEQAIELPLIQRGFTTLDEFITRAQTILQRRKARSGRSLELHTRHIFIEERLTEGVDFEQQPESDSGKRPDFIFPSERAYKDLNYPAACLRMLAVKTTCKDRWRQILNEADRIPRKHLLTLQEGVSESQFREMTEAGVQLVVPAPIVDKFPASVQPHLQTLESFIEDLRLLAVA